MKQLQKFHDHQAYIHHELFYFLIHMFLYTMHQQQFFHFLHSIGHQVFSVFQNQFVFFLLFSQIFQFTVVTISFNAANQN